MRHLIFFLVSVLFLSANAQKEITYQPNYTYYIAPITQTQLDFAIKNDEEKLPAEWIDKTIAQGDTLDKLKEGLPIGSYIIYTRGGKVLPMLTSSIYTKNNYSLSFYKVENTYYLKVVDKNSQPITNATITSPDKKVKVSNNNGLYAITKCKKYFSPRVVVSVNNEIGFYRLQPAGSTPYSAINNKSEKYQSMALLSQSQYRPLDTLRFSAVVFKGKKIVKEPLQVFMQTGSKNNNREYKLNVEVKPNNLCVYTLNYALPDSLDLDRSYTVYYTTKNKKVYESLSFYLKDYELDKTDVQVNTIKTNDSLQLAIKVQDNNGFTRIGSTVEITATPSIQEIYNDYLFVPTVFWHKLDTLNKDEILKVIIPDSVTKQFQGYVYFEVEIKTPTGELFNQQIYQNVGIDKAFKISADSMMHIEWMVDKKTQATKAELVYHKGDVKYKDTINVPYHQPIDENIRYNYVKIGDEFKDFSSLNTITGGHETSSGKLKFYLDNTHKKSVWYEVYKDKKLVQQGEYTDTVTLDFTPKSMYWLKYNYMKNGVTRSEFISYKPKPETLILDVQQPETTQPGKEVTFNFTATDIDGKPVNNAIILGTSASSQMPSNGDYHLENNDPLYRDTYIQNTNDVLASSVSGFLPYKEINQNTINLADFQAIYLPKEKVNATYLAIDSSKHSNLKRVDYGQFWPRITDKKYNQIAVYQVLVDGYLKYDRALDNPETMLISTGKHQIEIRTYNKMYLLKDVEIRKNEKLILSFNEDLNTQNLEAERRRKRVSKRRMNELANKVTVIQNMSNQDVIVQSVGRFSVRLAKNKYSYSSIYQTTLSPLNEGQTIEMVMEDGTVRTINFNSRTQYIITNDEVLKMPLKVRAERQKLKKYKASFGELTTLHPYGSLQFKKEAEQTPITWNYSTQNTVPANFELRGTTSNSFNKLIFQNVETDSIFMLAGMYNLYVPPGTYTLYIILGDSFSLYQNILVQANGKNYYRLDATDKRAISTASAFFDLFDTEKVFLKSIEGKQGLALELYLNNNVRLWETKVRVTTENGRDREYKTDKLGHLFIPLSRDETLTVQPLIKCLNDSLVPMTIIYKEVLGMYSTTKNWECSDQNLKNASIVNNRYVLSYNNILPRAGGPEYRKYKALQCPSFGDEEAPEAAEVMITSRKPIIEKDKNSVSFLGSRTDGTAYFVDGVRVTGNPQSRQEDKFDYGDGAGEIYEEMETYGSYDEKEPEIVLREDFSDLGFWMPGIQTDANGKASFTAKLPDDITTWRNLFITTDTKHRSTSKITTLKSYKPVMAQLHTPRFLVQGDEAWIKGELLNTTHDSLELDYEFKIDNQSASKNSVKVGLNYFAKQKISLSKNYAGEKYTVQFQTTDRKQFTDGEKRDIPVYPLGLLQKSGKVWELNAKETTDIQVNPADSSYITLLNTPKEMLGEMLKGVVNYEYNCNEQMASKLRATLLLLKYENTKKQQNDYEKQAKEYVKELTKNQQEDGSWGWWPNTRSNLWMTCYIVEALQKAKEQGFDNEAVQNAQRYIVRFYGGANDEYNNVLVTNTLLNTNADVSLDETHNSLSGYKSTEARITVARLSYLLKQDSTFAELQKLKNTDILGNTYWGVDSMNFGSVHLQNTCNVYGLLKNTNPTLAKSTEKYLWNRVYAMDRNNTYEAIWLAETLFDEEEKVVKNELCTISDGTGSRTINYFQKTAISGASVKISNPNNEKVYAIVANEKWVTNPAKRDSIISITTSYTDKITANNPAEVQVKVSSKKAMGYVQLSIPIPAGCSYMGEQQIYNATHSEFYKDRVNIYVENLASGEHTFSFKLLPKYEGDYNINPASVELMYFPVINGNNELKKVVIE